VENQNILNFCLEKGFLIDKEILRLFSETSDVESVKLIIEKIREVSQQKIITKEVFNQNKERVNNFFLTLPEENQKKLENLKIKLGLSIEISRKSHEVSTDLSKFSKFEEEKKSDKINFKNKQINSNLSNVRIIHSNPILNKKLEVKDFVNYFRSRFSEMKNILQERSELKNLISINKILGSRQNFSIIGLISDKRITKNKNILLEVEDLTGKIRVLISQNNPDIYKKAEEITLDSVIAFRGTGNREIIFANEVIFPDSIIFERKKSPVEEFVLFTADLHIGSKLFLEENFLKFIDYLNGKVLNTPEVEKIKYLIIAGDLIAGVGEYPGQEKDLKISDVESQYAKAAELLGKIRNNIKIIICPGNHDALRIMEPQPLLDEKYAWPLYNLKNIIFVTNPSQVNIGSRKGFSGFNILLYHGFSYHYYANNVSRLMKEKAVHQPDKLMHYLLKQKHLAPTHSSTLYFPSADDFLVIKDVPDIFISAHTHKSAVSYYNNILTISSSSWESKTAYQEKLGNEPDFCKVPMFNLKTRAIKILDFE
jgi:DNA polymerase II small subunit|tara:strand:+ start:5484 stop:7100 length:1617 start_codon:yes stop_codon:yes gene_type:complete